jgi:hypothetical protein
MKFSPFIRSVEMTVAGDIAAEAAIPPVVAAGRRRRKTLAPRRALEAHG